MQRQRDADAKDFEAKLQVAKQELLARADELMARGDALQARGDELQARGNTLHLVPERDAAGNLTGNIKAAAPT